jgi:hypothetical protein
MTMPGDTYGGTRRTARPARPGSLRPEAGDVGAERGGQAGSGGEARPEVTTRLESSTSSFSSLTPQALSPTPPQPAAAPPVPTSPIFSQVLPTSSSIPIDNSSKALGNPLGNHAGKPSGGPLLAVPETTNPEFSDEAELGSHVCLRARYAIAIAAQELTTKDSTRRCHRATSPVLVTRKRTETGSYVAGLASGIIRCGSLWACPFCAAPERFARAAELDRNCSAMLKTGHTLGFMVLTFGDAELTAKAAMTALLDYQRRMFSTEFMASLAALGYVGRVRSIEVTMRRDGTAHPHAQYVLAFSRSLSAVEFDELTQLLRRRWLNVTGMSDELVPVADLHAGFSLQRIGLDENDTCRAIAAYVTKGAESWSLGSEMNREDVKRSRGDTLAPFDVLREFSETGDTQLRNVWQEYEEATFGIAQTAYSRGFKAYLEVIRDKADAIAMTVPSMATPTATTAPVVSVQTSADEEPEEDVYDAGDGHKGFVLVYTATWNWMHRRRLLADFLIEVGRLAEGDDPVPHFQLWLAGRGAPIEIAMGFDEPTTNNESEMAA